MAAVGVSGVVAARGEGARLAETVRACLEEGVVDEVVVVCDAAAAGYGIQGLPRGGKRVEVVVWPEKGGPGAARDRGVRRAAGETVVFLDAPGKPEKGALKRVVEAVEEAEGKALVVPILCSLDAGEWANREWEVVFGYSVDLDRMAGRFPLPDELPKVKGVSADRMRETPALFGGCFALRRDLYWELDGFDTELRNGEVAGIDLALRAWLRGYPVRVVAGPMVGHGFHGTTGYGPDRPADVLADKIRVARKVLGDDEWARWLDSFGRGRPEGLWCEAWKAFEEKREGAERARAALRVKRVHDVGWYAERFSLTWPPPEWKDEDGEAPEGVEEVDEDDPWQERPEAVAAQERRCERFIEAIPAFPEGWYEGRGVVICGGGYGYFPGVWVCVRSLRERGCTLPIQVWHLGCHEVDDALKGLLEPYDVECVDAGAVSEWHPVRRLGGWTLKPYSILYSRFEEVLLLDADNMVLADPTALFDRKEYRETGAAFWPDFGMLAPQRGVWSACGVGYRDEAEFESGQLLVNKRTCWDALNLALHLNEESHYYYHYVHGDKELFHVAFRRLGRPYAMVPYPIREIYGCMCQHDFNGRRLFQHRNGDKWKLDGSNHVTDGFVDEASCRRYLADLRELWKPGPERGVSLSPEGTRVGLALCGKRLRYRREGHKGGELVLKPDGTIGLGAGPGERRWSVDSGGGRLRLTIVGDVEVTCRLDREGGVWKGVHDGAEVELEADDGGA